MRGHFDEAKASLIALHGELQAYTGPFELPEPDADLRKAIQHVVDNEVKYVPMR